MEPGNDAPDEDNNDDDNGNDGHDEREGDNNCLDNNVRGRDQHYGCNAVEEDYWFYRPFECLGNTFRANQDEDDESQSSSPTAGVIDCKGFVNAKNTEVQKEHHTLRMPTVVELLCSMTTWYWTDVTNHMSSVALSALFVLETMVARVQTTGPLRCPEERKYHMFFPSLQSDKTERF